MVDVVAESTAENIPVVIYDSGLAAGAEIVSYVATDNRRGGRLAGERLAESLGHRGKVILLRYNEGSESTEQREEGFLEAMANEKGIEVLSSDQYAGTSTQEAFEKATQLLNKYRDEVTGIFAVCEPNANGTLEALEQTGLAGKVKFVAFDPSDRLIRGLEEKTVDSILLQDPFEMGRQAVLAIVQKIRGQKVEPVISTAKMLRLRKTKIRLPTIDCFVPSYRIRNDFRSHHEPLKPASGEVGHAKDRKAFWSDAGIARRFAFRLCGTHRCLDW